MSSSFFQKSWGNNVNENHTSGTKKQYGREELPVARAGQCWPDPNHKWGVI